MLISSRRYHQQPSRLWVRFLPRRHPLLISPWQGLTMTLASPPWSGLDSWAYPQHDFSSSHIFNHLNDCKDGVLLEFKVGMFLSLHRSFSPIRCVDQEVARGKRVVWSSSSAGQEEQEEGWQAWVGVLTRPIGESLLWGVSWPSRWTCGLPSLWAPIFVGSISRTHVLAPNLTTTMCAA